MTFFSPESFEMYQVCILEPVMVPADLDPETKCAVGFFKLRLGAKLGLRQGGRGRRLWGHFDACRPVVQGAILKRDPARSPASDSRGSSGPVRICTSLLPYFSGFQIAN